MSLIFEANVNVSRKIKERGKVILVSKQDELQYCANLLNDCHSDILVM